MIDLQARIKQLDQWQADLNMPASVWLSGLFNPQSFLTAIMQTAARKNTWQLDKVQLTILYDFVCSNCIRSLSIPRLQRRLKKQRVLHQKKAPLFMGSS